MVLDSDYLLLLRFLDDDTLIGVANALALVGLRRTIAANFCGNLADLLLVGAFHDNLGLAGRFDRDAFRHLETKIANLCSSAGASSKSAEPSNLLWS